MPGPELLSLWVVLGLAGLAFFVFLDEIKQMRRRRRPVPPPTPEQLEQRQLRAQREADRIAGQEDFRSYWARQTRDERRAVSREYPGGQQDASHDD